MKKDFSPLEYKTHPVQHFNTHNFRISEGIVCISPRTYSSQSGLITNDTYHSPHCSYDERGNQNSNALSVPATARTLF